jgi:hypothetical protein
MLDFTRGENVNLCWAPKGLEEKNNFTVRQIDFYAGLERQHRLVSISEREWRRKSVRHEKIILIIRKKKCSPNYFTETSS